MVSPGNFITTATNYYNTLGELVQSTDGRGNSTYYNYADRWSPSGSCGISGSTSAYPTTVTDATGAQTVTTYNACDGATYSVQNQNDLNAGRAGTVYTYDGLHRVINVASPDGGSQQTSYGGTALPQVITKTTAITSSSSSVSSATLDGLGRTTQTQLQDPQGTVYSATTYDNLGRTFQVYNPTRCNPPTTNCGESTWGLTTYKYDALGRTLSITEPDNSVVTSSYFGNSTTVTDEASNWRESFTDALGRLYEVEEPQPAPQGGSGSGSSTPGTGSLTFSGQEQWYEQDDICAEDGTGDCPGYGPDSGNITITVNGVPISYPYGQSDTPSTIAAGFATETVGGSFPVLATASGPTLTLTSMQAGANTNYAVSVSVQSTGWPEYCGTDDNPNCWTPPPTSFYATPSSFSLTGGTGQGTQGTSPLYTYYTYDALDDLTSVTEAGSRPRSFSYDSLGRLLSATNPESGTVTYTYDANSNVLTKTDARQITTTFSYDVLNRLTKKSYSNGTHAVLFAYAGNSLTGCSIAPPAITISNGVGQRTAMCDAGGAESWSYDPMGRTAKDARAASGVSNPFTFNYTYYLDGSPKTLAYPSGHTIAYTTDSAGRPSLAYDQTTGVYYATGTCNNGVGGNGVCYAPQGAMAQAQNGSNLVSTFIYNDRLQPCWTYVTTGTALARSTSCTASDPGPGNILDLQYSYNPGTDNGNVMGTTNKIDGLRSQTFTYDTLNRLLNAQTNSTYSTSSTKCWGESYSYDAWGNLLATSRPSSSYTSCTQETPPGGNANNNNRISAFCYDAAGNLLLQSACPQAPPYNYQYAYDAENHLLSAGGVNYTYDGDGNRVMKSNGTIYWYGGGSDLLDETNLSGNLTNEYVFFGGARIALRDSSGNLFYYYSDHLGTARTIAEVPSGQTTATKCYDADFYPFGGERWYTDSCDSHYKFTAKERDTESGLDNFGARYNASTLGRFMSPDPDNAGAAAGNNPQSWNAYSYVLNNPLNAVDPDGLDCIYPHSGLVIRGDCLSGTDDGLYINGTIIQKSVVYNSWDQTLSFSFTNYDTGLTDSQIIAGVDLPVTGDDLFNAAALGTRMAEPGVNFAAEGLRVFGYIAAAPLMFGAECIAGAPSCTKGNAAMSLLPELGALREGALVLKEGAAVGKGAEILQKGGGMEQAVKDFESLQGAEKTIGNVKVKELADGTKAVLYESEGSGPTVALQEGGRTVTKIRY